MHIPQQDGTLAEEYASIVSKIGLIKKIEDQEKLPISEYEELKIKDL